MKIRCTIWFGVVSLALMRSVAGQDFVNLDFEDAVITPDPTSPYYPYGVYANQALPGWTISADPFFETVIFYNDYSLGATCVQLFGNNSTFSPPPLDGSFSVDLYGGQTTPGGASISQTGLVPGWAKSIQFEAQPVPFFGTVLLLSLGGKNIPFSAIGGTLYGANVSAFAGQVEPLTFTAPEGVNNAWEIDDIFFSASAVPEPSIFSLFGICTLFLCWRVKRPNNSPEPPPIRAVSPHSRLTDWAARLSFCR